VLLTHARYVDALRGEVARVGALAATADFDLPVPHCPGWQVETLLGHLGGVHRWVTEVVRTGKRADQPTSPERADLLEWFDTGAATLLTTLTQSDQQRGCWSFAPPHQVSFWSRRQVQETLVHRWDLELALGLHVRGDPELAADGIDEVIAMFFPRQVRLGRQAPLTEAMAVVDAQSGRRWLVTGDGTATDATATDSAADVTVTGDAVPLLLLLWKRLDLAASDLRVDGDAEIARRVLGARLTP
jgi:uncharacterized protein (TIGR03083 family)